MLASTLLVALGLSIASTTATPVDATKRDTDSSSIGQLWAYGIGIGGLPLWYGDGIAYVGSYPPANVTSAANVTLSNSDTTVVATVNTTTSGNTTVSGTSKLYIDTSDGAFSVAGFTNASSSTTSKTTTGFRMYGTKLIWVASDDSVQSFWYAEPVDGTDDVYKIYWNANNVDTEAVLVVIKNLGPDGSSS